jgi:hypothetical protein
VACVSVDKVGFEDADYQDVMHSEVFNNQRGNICTQGDGVMILKIFSPKNFAKQIGAFCSKHCKCFFARIES